MPTAATSIWHTNARMNRNYNEIVLRLFHSKVSLREGSINGRVNDATADDSAQIKN